MSAIDNRATAILALLANAPNGLTIHDLAQHLGCDKQLADQAIRHLRTRLANDPTETLYLVCDPAGWQQPWLYRLIDGSGVMDQAMTRWGDNRIRDAEARLSTIRGSLDVAVRATNGRTVAGRKARQMQSVLAFLEQQLDLIV